MFLVFEMKYTYNVHTVFEMKYTYNVHIIVFEMKYTYNVHITVFEMKYTYNVHITVFEMKYTYNVHTVFEMGRKVTDPVVGTSVEPVASSGGNLAKPCKRRV